MENQFGCMSCERDSERDSERMTLCSSAEEGAEDGTARLWRLCVHVKESLCEKGDSRRERGKEGEKREEIKVSHRTRH